MNSRRLVLAVFASLMLGGSAPAGPIYSELWGRNGERWTPQSRLPDFSFAGYRFGEKPLPDVAVTANVKDFGAKGDGRTDDTAAFKRAIEKTTRGAILIPAGSYVISDILWIEKPNIVLRGKGAGKTILLVTTELEEVRPNMGNTTSGRPTSNYSWSGGFLWVKGWSKSPTLSDVVSDARRGECVLKLATTAGIQVGQRVQIEMQDDDRKSLLTHLYSGDPGDTSKITRPVTVRMVSRVASVSASRITLERPLRWDLRKAWSPTVKAFTPKVSEVGIEQLAIRFPVKPYKGHFTERGMNAIAMNGASDCWVRNVRISNCDSGIFLGGSFCTIDGLIIDGSRKPTGHGDTGHHGVTMGHDCLITNFDLREKFIHDFTLTSLQSGNVIKNGKGKNLSFDHHKRGPFENLVCNVDVGDGRQIWRCGGGANLGKHCGARGTFWCIRAKHNVRWPNSNFGPDSINIVGVTTTEASIKTPDGKWFEAIPPDALRPADLHAAQLANRMKAKKND